MRLGQVEGGGRRGVRGLERWGALGTGGCRGVRSLERWGALGGGSGLIGKHMEAGAQREAVVREN